jgi:hypothetical protein
VVEAAALTEPDAARAAHPRPAGRTAAAAPRDVVMLAAVAGARAPRASDTAAAEAADARGTDIIAAPNASARGHRRRRSGRTGSGGAQK